MGGDCGCVGLGGCRGGRPGGLRGAGAAASPLLNELKAGLTLGIVTVLSTRPGTATLKWAWFLEMTLKGPTYGAARGWVS